MKTKHYKEMINTVKKIILPVCEWKGFELVHLEYQREFSVKTFRFYIKKPKGVSLNDCMTMSKKFKDILNAELPNFKQYHVEVSSPGIKLPIKNQR